MEEILWQKGLLGDHSPQVLVNTMVYLMGLCFTLKSGRGVTNSPKRRTDFEIFTKFEGFHGFRLRFHNLRLTRPFKACKAIQNQE